MIIFADDIDAAERRLFIFAVMSAAELSRLLRCRHDAAAES